MPPLSISAKKCLLFSRRVSVSRQNLFESREIIQSLKTENREEATYQVLKIAANFIALLLDLKAGRVNKLALNAGGCFIKLPGQQQKVVQCVRGE